MLPSAEKFQIWQQHFEKKRSEFQVGTEEWKLVDELMRFNQVQFYDSVNDRKEIASAYFSKEWLKRAEKVFKAEQVFQIAYSLNSLARERDYFGRYIHSTGSNDVQKLEQPGSPYNNEALPDCICMVGSNYTCPYPTFVMTTMGMVPEIHFARCSYNSSLACDVEGGCGFGGWYLCNGNICS